MSSQALFKACFNKYLSMCVSMPFIIPCTEGTCKCTIYRPVFTVMCYVYPLFFRLSIYFDPSFISIWNYFGQIENQNYILETSLSAETRHRISSKSIQWFWRWNTWTCLTYAWVFFVQSVQMAHSVMMLRLDKQGVWNLLLFSVLNYFKEICLVH
jgi:hypothetical protein